MKDQTEDEDTCNLFAPDEDVGNHMDDDCSSNNDDSITSKKGLISPNAKQYDRYVDKLRGLLADGQGEALFEVGVGDCGDIGLNEVDLNASVATLRCIAEQLDCDMSELRNREAQNGKTSEFLLRQRFPEEDFNEVRIAVVGNVDAGKSTLLGVLTHGTLDDGRGTARLKLFRHKHEADTGRTSSVGSDILGFDSKGQIVNKPDAHSGALDWIQICREASKVLTFIDLAGHEKYLKTTVFGMTGHAPDFAMLMVGANAGVVGMTKEHLGLALALNVPVFVVVTKIDMCPSNVLAETMKLLARILKSPGCRKMFVAVQNVNDVIISAENFVSERICPIFQVSNVTGQNLDLLKMFLNLLTAQSPQTTNESALFQIDDTYSVPGVGIVVSGLVKKGVIKVNDVLSLGPDGLGKFQPLPVKSIHRKRMPVTEIRAGQTGTFSLKKVKRNEIRKGMVMISQDRPQISTWEFDADVLILHHPTTISARYQAMVHCGSMRQTAKIVKMDKEHLRSGDKSSVRFRFIQTPEYIEVGTKMIFREGLTKAVGTITKVHNDVEGKSTNNRRKQRQFVRCQVHQKSQSSNKRRTKVSAGRTQEFST